MTQKAHKHKHFMGISLPREFIWDITVLIFASVLISGPLNFAEVYRYFAYNGVLALTMVLLGCRAFGFRSLVP